MNKEQAFEQITLVLLDTYKSKNQDYGDSFGKLYQEFGLTSSVVRFSDKVERLKSLIRQAYIQQTDDLSIPELDSLAKVSDEKIIDTVMDLANYAIMTLIELRNGE